MGVISVDTTELKAFADAIENLAGPQKETLFHNCLNDLGNRLIALVVPRTPVGKTTQLRGGWTNAVGSPTSSGSVYSIEVINPTPYASYVEYGHRQSPGRFVPAIGKRLKASWVEGKFFLRGAEEDLEKVAPSAVKKQVEAYLRTVF